MADTDVWWHLSGGRWILEHGRVPHLDPFTYGSADRPWVDIHWGFEVVAVLAHRAGGVPALVLLAAAAGCAAVVAALTARRRAWPAAVTALCWLPALVLVSWRFDPRPEIFSLLYLSLFLAVLWRADDRPRLAWVLPVLEVLWANTQGLFVLGPVVVAMFLAARGGRLLWDRMRGRAGPDAAQRRWWLHVGGASLAVAAAVLVNPYGVAGARFPFDLFPKVAQEGNPYKEYIDELNSPRRLVEKSHGKALANGYIRALYLLLLAVPASFALPAAWRAWRAAPTSPKRQRGDKVPLAGASGLPVAVAWLGTAAALAALLVLAALGLPSRGVPAVIAFVGAQTPVLLAAAGVAAAAALARRSRPAAAVAAVSGAALALWAAWLRGFLLADPAPAVPSVAPAVGALLVAAAVLLWQGADPFRLLLAGGFGYLAVQAQQNDSRFALVAGLVLSWNLGEWAAEVAACLPPGRPAAAAGWAFRLGVCGLLAALIVGVLTERYGRWTGVPRNFSLREQPFEAAHDAIRFAGQPGLPERALLYDLGQPGLYDWYHGPARKPFLDGRLEMPALETFQTYVNIDNWLNDNDPRWVEAVGRLGNPLVVLTHTGRSGAEAALLTHPGWRCVWFDAVAAVFVPRGDVSEAAFPSVDFAARHFRPASAPLVPDQPGAAFRELRALVNLGTVLRRSARGSWHVPVLLAALGRAPGALAEGGEHRGAGWALLGHCHRALVFDRNAPAPATDAAWDPAAALPLAQATYCYRRALEEAPAEAAALQGLYEVFKVRVMADALRAAGERLVALGEATAAQAKEVERLRRALGPPSVGAEVGSGELPGAVTRLLAGGRVEAAVRLVEAAEARGDVAWTWPLAQAVAGAYMHLGRPADARRVWQRCPSPPSEAVRRCRLAETYWVERDFDTAARLFHEARELDGGLAEACWGLAMLETQRGRAGPALAACQAGLRSSPYPRQRTDLQSLEGFLKEVATAEATKP
jgi:hypothetical protein